ncbi:MAG: GIY-YIG nuclease family protein [Burkholderiales bacterium]
MRRRVAGQTQNGMSWWCYILQCADGTLYTGITNDFAKRIAAHNAGTASKYTRVRLPARPVYREARENRSDAAKREAQIKRLTREQKIGLINRALKSKASLRKIRTPARIPVK